MSLNDDQEKQAIKRQEEQMAKDRAAREKRIKEDFRQEQEDRKRKAEEQERIRAKERAREMLRQGNELRRREEAMIPQASGKRYRYL